MVYRRADGNDDNEGDEEFPEHMHSNTSGLKYNRHHLLASGLVFLYVD